MAKVPTDRNAKAAKPRTCCEEFIIMVGGPTPFTYCPSCGQWNEWNEIDGKPVVMRGLPRPRFTGPAGENIELPQGTAETLERFEQGLRLAGFIGPREHLVQSMKAFNRFRVTKLKAREPDILITHNDNLRTSEASPPDDSGPNWVA